MLVLTDSLLQCHAHLFFAWLFYYARKDFHPPLSSLFFFSCQAKLVFSSGIFISLFGSFFRNRSFEILLAPLCSFWLEKKETVPGWRILKNDPSDGTRNHVVAHAQEVVTGLFKFTASQSVFVTLREGSQCELELNLSLTFGQVKLICELAQ